MRFSLVVVAMVVWLVAADSLGQSVRFVRSNAPANGDGLTWATAHRRVFEALDAAAADPAITQIWIAQATYTPNRTGNNRDDAFELVHNVTLYGGFVGNETSLAQRDPLANPTLLSGDLLGNDGANFVNIADNSRHVVVALDFPQGMQSPPAVLDGLTIRSGNADFPGDDLLGGGAIFLRSAAVSIVNCRFTANSAGQNQPDIGGFGGAIYNLGGALDVTDSTFTGNRATNGGCVGIRDHNDSAVSANFVNCQFIGNRAEHQTGGVMWSGVNPFDTVERSVSFDNCLFENNIAQYGGAITEQNIKRVRFTDCVFRHNQAFVVGGALWHSQTGGPDQEPMIMKRCTFIDNEGNDAGGAIFMTATGAVIVASHFLGNSANGIGGAIRCGPQFGTSFGVGNLDLHDCAFVGNTAQLAGAVAALRTPFTRIINCTLAANTASGSNAGGGILSDAFNLTVANCILWQNQAAGAMNQAAQISHATSFGPLALNRSCVQGLDGSLGGVGNIASNPQFVDLSGIDDILGTIDDDVRVQARSPVIDAADLALLPTDASDLDDDANVAEPLPLDLANEIRVQGEQCDMGALESPDVAKPIPGDTNNDGQVNADDLVNVILAWGGCANCPPPASACPADVNQDCAVDADDLVIVILNWT